MNDIERNSIEIAALSHDPYPVDFDEAWQWLQYSTKGNARRKLEANFAEGTDYILLIRNDK